MIDEMIFLNQRKIIISQREFAMLLVVTTLNVEAIEIKIKYDQ